jgi:hypothetical protein
MRSGNTLDGMYFFLLVIPFVLSLWMGDLLRKKIVNYLVLESEWSQSLSSFFGIAAEILIIISGVSAGFLLVKLV